MMPYTPVQSIQTTLARIVYQSRKRGTLENDLLLTTFAQELLGTMDVQELSKFDKIRCVRSFQRSISSD